MAKISIYLTNLAAYTRGRLQGEWVALPIDEEELAKVYKRIGIGKASEGMDEEVFITDWESEINGVRIGEYESVSKLNEFAEQLEELDDYEIEIVEGFLSNSGMPDAWHTVIEEVQEGNWRYYEGATDMSDVAMTVLEEGYSELLESLPAIIRDNLDYEAMGNWLDTSGTYVSTSGGYLEIF